ncbi:MAG: hypothetical protein A3G75_15475 [Verrucomicrobia bacterium RIFCSPLOWO2_12_FULL_64_8]|nr:MAG: hypothetical protein A3G75_15475 [Verrucomicrobia bacterium RIFCSPLOWO2_12_FULL_64_8]
MTVPPADPVPPQDPEQARWFAEQLQPHEALLRAWLRSRFPAGFDFDDIVQEAYLRTLRARKSGEIKSAKAFLFATARNLALGRVRHDQSCGIDSLAEMEALGILDENTDVRRTVARGQELELLTQAIQSLPARCRQILTLRKIYCLSQKEVAAQLGIAEHTVEAQGTIALRKLAAFFERCERKGASRRE